MGQVLEEGDKAEDYGRVEVSSDNLSRSVKTLEWSMICLEGHAGGSCL